jgi:hypothetical protein
VFNVIEDTMHQLVFERGTRTSARNRGAFGGGSRVDSMFVRVHRIANVGTGVVMSAILRVTVTRGPTALFLTQTHPH